MRSSPPNRRTAPVPLIRRTPGVCGGEACVRDTRIPVWLLVRYRQLGANDAALLRQYPGLTADDLAAVWRYSAAHREEIEAAIAAQSARI